MAITPELLGTIDSFEKLASKLFHDELGWPKPKWETFSGVPKLYGLKQNDIPGVVELSAVQKLDEKQDWGIFLVDFGKNELKRGDLRRILNKVAEKARAQHDNPTWPHGKILFICRSENNNWTFAYFTGDKLANAKLRRFGWENPREARTAIENLQKLEWNKDWSEAWNVEKLTKEFFTKLSDLFFDAMQAVKNVIPDENERRLFIQTLFNRLIFLRFVEKKGWLKFNGRDDYLRALWENSEGDKYPFWPTRLNALFNAVNHPLSDEIHKISKPIIGDVQYLNGGLFDEDHRFADPEIKIPDKIFEELLGEDGLFYRYNFTVEESSPLDVQVAVDPEILGKIFEQLTIATKRHDTGSYYTPREIVQFMCREALVGYLGGKGISEDKARKLVYEHDDKELTNQEGNLAFEALKAIKVVDPACGSGAYLLGMLQELYALFEKLRRDDRKFSDDPAKEAHERKLWIIENNIYGVDLQAFATNTAMLRLWLTLLVEDTGETPQPLPNLEYKIETGDSLLGPDPSQPVHVTKEKAGQQVIYDTTMHTDIEDLRILRARYQDSHGKAKTEVKKEFEAKLSELREKVTGSPTKDPAKFDWRVEFFDVFLEDPAKRQPGFDIALANPPYVRQEDLLQAKGREYKTALERAYSAACVGKSDLFCYFYARTLQMLAEGGYHVFVCSNSWLDVGFGGQLQKYLLENSWVQAIYDSAVERSFATADINTIISILRKGRPPNEARSSFVSLRAPFEKAMAEPEFRRTVVKTRDELWAAGLDEDGQFDGDKWGGKYLRAPDVYWKIIERAGDRLVRLGDIADVRRGFTTGANDFFYVRVLSVENGIARIRCDDGSEHLIEEEYVREPVLVKAKEIVRPLVRVSDLRYRLVRLDEAARSRPHAKRYIEWGEASRLDDSGNEIGQFHERPTTRGRNQWYIIRVQEYATCCFPMAHKRRAAIGALGDQGINIDARAYGVYPRDSASAMVLTTSLISTFSTMCREIYGRANFGQGMLDVKVYEAEDLPTLNPPRLVSTAQLANAFEALANRPIQMIYDEVRNADRRALDDAFLQAIGFDDPTERAAALEELYNDACRMVWTRQAKAPRTRESRQTYDDWLASGAPFGDVGEEE